MVEWLIKIPLYLFVSLMVYFLAYGIIGYGYELQGRPRLFGPIVVLLIQTYWMFHTLRRLSKPLLTIEQRHQKRRKRLLVSFVLPVGSTIISIESFSMAFAVETMSDPSGITRFFVQIGAGVIGLISGIFALMMYSYFFLSLHDRT